jgi:hypothetical protein
VREAYPLDGAPATAKRRDLRRGRHTGRVAPSADGRLRLEVSWEDPHGGAGVDEFFLAGPDELRVATSLRLGSGREVAYTQVYLRRGAGGPPAGPPPADGGR